MRRLVWPFLLAVAPPTIAVDGVVTVDSPYSVQITAQRAAEALEQRGLEILGTIDHAAEARRSGVELAPIELVLFRAPQVDNALLRCKPTLGLELPQRALAWEDTAGRVKLSYPDPEAIASRHAIGDCGEALTRLSASLKDMAFAATSEEPATLSADGAQPPSAASSTDSRDR